MIRNPKHRTSGIAVAEWVATLGDELSRDAVGLWQIIPGLRHGFDLTQAELEYYIYACVLDLCKRGAKPVFGKIAGPYHWEVTTQYGLNADDIARSIVSEWIHTDTDPDVEAVWFALPEIYEERRE